MTPSQSPLEIIAALAARAGLDLPELFDEFDLPEGVTAEDVTSGAYVLTLTEISTSAGSSSRFAASSLRLKVNMPSSTTQDSTPP